MTLTLYTYFRSSASYRVRIVMALKNIQHSEHYINLLLNQQKAEEYTKYNPQQLIPILQDEQKNLSQSLAIIEYLNEVYKEPNLLPEDIFLRAKVREWSLTIACEMHPLNNLRVLKYLTETLKVNEEQKNHWYHHWLHSGLTSLEKMVKPYAGSFCLGDQVTMADVCLIPQLYNALRFKHDVSQHPTLMSIYENCLQLESFQKASPEQQGDRM